LGTPADADSNAEMNSPDTAASHSSTLGREDESELLDLSREDEVSIMLLTNLFTHFKAFDSVENRHLLINLH
jgi:hypothetical protein